MTNLTKQRNAQSIALFACEQDSARQLGSGAEHTLQTAKELLEEGKVSKKNNPNFCFMFHPFFGAKKRIFGRVKPGERGIRVSTCVSKTNDNTEREENSKEGWSPSSRVGKALRRAHHHKACRLGFQSNQKTQM